MSELLLSMMGCIEAFTLARATAGLTDDEFFWEPAPGCWTVRLSSDGRAVMDFDADVAGEPSTSDAHPLTTIAWNLAHICDAPIRAAEFDFLGGARPAGSYDDAAEPPTSASEAVARLLDGWGRLKAAVAATSDAALARSWQWAFGTTPGAAHVALVVNEVSHHGAQVCGLRDLYRRLN